MSVRKQHSDEPAREQKTDDAAVHMPEPEEAEIIVVQPKARKQEAPIEQEEKKESEQPQEKHVRSAMDVVRRRK